MLIPLHEYLMVEEDTIKAISSGAVWGRYGAENTTEITLPCDIKEVIAIIANAKERK